jgi:hypothetical protein
MKEECKPLHRELRLLEYFNQNANVRFQVLTTASMKMAVFWVLALCSMVVYRYQSDMKDIWRKDENI